MMPLRTIRAFGGKFRVYTRRKNTPLPTIADLPGCLPPKMRRAVFDELVCDIGESGYGPEGVQVLPPGKSTVSSKYDRDDWYVWDIGLDGGPVRSLREWCFAFLVFASQIGVTP